MNRILKLTALATFLVLAATAAAAAPGDLDPTFGSGGKLTTGIGEANIGEAVVVQPDGKIVVGASQGRPTGDAWAFGLVRFNRDGTLDKAFGSGGKVATPFGTSARITALALQPDRKIVAVGWSFVSPGFDFALARYNADGSLDSSFGDGGRVKTDFTTVDEVHAVVVQPDGKIVVAGQALGRFALARYRPDGSLDPSFGSGGKVVSIEGAGAGESGGATALVLQRDGKLVAAGEVYVDPRAQFGLLRFNPDGARDTSFGSDGIAHAVVGSSWSLPNDTALQRDGNIVAAGAWEDRNGNFNWGLARWSPDGKLDDAFGRSGVVVTPAGSWAAAVAVQSNGKIVAAGDRSSPDGSLATLIRFQPNGDLDRDFGSGGVTTTGYGSDPYSYAAALALQPDGKIVVAGTSVAPPAANTQVIGVARFLGDATCVVPRVKGKPLATGKRAIAKARCRLGKVARRFSSKVRRGRIVSQKPGPGASVATATKVALVVSKGRRR